MTGFTYNAHSKQWNYARFKTDFHYVVAPPKNEPNVFALITKIKVGETDPRYGYCEHDFNDAGYIHCDTLGGDFRFNRLNGRYLNVFAMGYVDVGVGSLPSTELNSSTPAIEIGKCTPF